MRATKVVLALLGAIAIASTAAGESTHEALQWLGRMADVYSGGPLTYGYEVHTSITDMGQTATVKMKGRSTQSDRSHFRIEATTEMTVPGEESPMKVRLLGVSDGEVMWVETEDPTSGTMVIKMPLDKLEQIAEAIKMGHNVGWYPSGTVLRGNKEVLGQHVLLEKVLARLGEDGVRPPILVLHQQGMNGSPLSRISNNGNKIDDPVGAISQMRAAGSLIK